MFLSEIYLIIIGVGIGYLLYQLNSRQSFRVKNMFEHQEEVKRVKSKDFLSKRKWTRWMSPAPFVEEAQKYDWNVSEKEYWVFVFVGGILGSAAIQLFQLYFLSPIGFLVGFMVPKVMLYLHKRKNKLKTEEKLMIYMKATANAMPVYGNAVDTLTSITPLLEDPIKKDVESALAILQSGKSVEYAFRELNRKYKYKELHFFHDMLDVAHKHGGEFHDILMTTAEEFEQKKLLQMKLHAALTQSKQAFRQNALIVIAIPFFFKFFTPEIYDKIIGTTFGKGALVFIIVSIVFAFVKVEQHSRFDPSESVKK
ncbi:hypothetical protein L1765_11080 [Microaerobacter geothermalis]|uniref:type II secretion system F family protein n=1 Tax=Microaerobacter geothermalis TaxID=674972 RepID=UPI001F29A241|nr:hypothetical protein [Microaerobacter geothermalis]MCF6094506.1 hypothetical protein [Microaerobacter geothermalis]